MSRHRLSSTDWEGQARHGHTIGKCAPCDKYIYISRKAARRVRGNLRQAADRGRLNAYQCPHTDGWWHLGNLPSIPDARDQIRAHRARSPSRGTTQPATTYCDKETC